MQILISWSRVPSKSRFRSFVKILFWVENPLLWRGIRDGQNSCCTCHNTKGWKYICVLRKQAGNKLTVHSSFFCTYSVLWFWFRWFYTEKTHWKLHLEKTSEAFNLRPNQRTCVRGRKKPSVGKTLRLCWSGLHLSVICIALHPALGSRSGLTIAIHSGMMTSFGDGCLGDVRSNSDSAKKSGGELEWCKGLSDAKARPWGALGQTLVT